MGEGFMGEVFQAKRRYDGRKVVMKRLNLNLCQDLTKDLDAVFPFLKGAQHHPNICEFLEHYKDAQYQYIVMEFVEGANLVKTLEEQDTTHFSEDEILRYFAQIIFGLQYLHKHHLLHRDLKPESILVTPEGFVKLVDFVPRLESSVKSDFDAYEEKRKNKEPVPHVFQGQRLYRAPELWRKKVFTRKSDIWSAGCVLYELVTRHRAFNAPSREEMEQNICAVKYSPIQRNVSADLIQLILNMLQKRPTDRPYTSDVLEQISTKVVMEVKDMLIAELQKQISEETPLPNRSLPPVMSADSGIFRFEPSISSAAGSPRSFTPETPLQKNSPMIVKTDSEKFQDYDFVGTISSGLFGTVMKVIRREDDEIFMARKLSVEKAGNSGVDDVLHECRMLKGIRHANIIEYIDHFQHDGFLYVIMEYVDGVLLSEALSQRKKLGKRLSEEEIQRYFIQIMLALKYLHSKNIVHLNIKPSNIFVNKIGIVKVLNFGLSAKLENENDTLTLVCGTPIYMCPEMYDQKPYNTKADMWIAGCILYELIALEPAFYAPTKEKISLNVLAGAYPPFKRYVDPQLVQLVSLLLEVRPQHRLTAAEVLRLPILNANLSKKGDEKPLLVARVEVPASPSKK